MLHFKSGIAALGAAALLLTSGCGAAASASEASDAPIDSASTVSITVWNYYNGDQLDSFNSMVDEFNETVGKEKGIQVSSYSQGGVSDLETNVMASAEGKVGADPLPNIFSGYADTTYALDQMGMVVDLSDYLTDEERSAYIDGYLAEGDFSGSSSIKIFPTAKSTELLFLNKTDWEPFAEATGASYDDLQTIEGVVGGLNASIGDELFQCDPRNFTANRVKAGKGDRLRGIVDDEVNASLGLKSPDVPALTANDTALHLIVGQRHN